MEEAQRNYPGPRGFLSPWKEYQATDKEAARENLQDQILTLVQIYWRGKINQLSRVFSRLLYFLSLHHFALRLSPFHGSSLRKPLASRVQWNMNNTKNNYNDNKTANSNRNTKEANSTTRTMTTPECGICWQTNLNSIGENTFNASW